jgi:ribosomal protein L11 methyltransferase
MASTTKEPNRVEWVQVDVAATVDSAELLSALGDPHVAGAWQEEHVVHLYWPEIGWGSDTLKALHNALERLGIRLEPSSLTINRLPQKDWNAEWARRVEPIRIGRFLIRSSWHAVALQADDLELVIDPKQAFGTGHHATTQLLLEWLPELIGPRDRVLDVGTGSGILAMAALKLGAACALGLDNDAVAVDCARDYACANGFDDRLQLDVLAATDETASAAFAPTLVLANLDRQTLLTAAQALSRQAARGARLLLSGLLADQRTEIEEIYGRNGVYLIRSRERDGWLALELGAMEGCEG